MTSLRDRLEKARIECLEEQRECAWCNFKAKSADELVEHILEQHPKDPVTGLRK